MKKSDLLIDAKVTACSIEGVGDAYVREATGSEYDYITEQGLGEMARVARSIICCLCDADGNAIFDRGDEAEILKQPIRRIEKIAGAIIKHAGINPGEQADAVGNLETTTPSDSGTS